MASSERARRRIFRIFERRYLERARLPEAEHMVEDKLGGKIATLQGRPDRYTAQLMKIVQELKQVWAERGKLDKKHVLYLTAALVYFISPLDTIPDAILGVGFADDLMVLVFVLQLIRESLKSVTDKLAESIVEKAKDEAEEIVDRAATTAVQRSLSAVVIGLWGLTTAGAVSLAIAVVLGELPRGLVVYTTVVAVLVGVWNVTVAVRYLRKFWALEARLQDMLASALLSRVGMREVVAVGAPVVLLIALGVLRGTMWIQE